MTNITKPNIIKHSLVDFYIFEVFIFLPFFTQDFFGKLIFGHFFCPFLKILNILLQKMGFCCIIEIYDVVAKILILNLLR